MISYDTDCDFLCFDTVIGYGEKRGIIVFYPCFYGIYTLKKAESGEKSRLK